MFGDWHRGQFNMAMFLVDEGSTEAVAAIRVLADLFAAAGDAFVNLAPDRHGQMGHLEVWMPMLGEPQHLSGTSRPPLESIGFGSLSRAAALGANRVKHGRDPWKKGAGHRSARRPAQ
jgi:hypothetical protein